jgi:hypothetical protein
MASETAPQQLHMRKLAHIDRTTIGLRSELADLGELLDGPDGLVVLVTIHPLVDGKCLLISRDGLFVLLEVGEQTSEVVQCGRVLRMVVAIQVAGLLNSFLVACDGLAPLLCDKCPCRSGAPRTGSLPCAAPRRPWPCCR